MPLLKSHHQDLGKKLAHNTFARYVQSNDDIFLFRGDPLFRIPDDAPVICKFPTFKGKETFLTDFRNLVTFEAT